MFEIINETNEEIKEIDDIKYVLEIAKKEENLDNIEFNVIIVDNEYIHNLNKEYRHIDRPTDVITFALEDEKNMPDVPGMGRILGDIYISIDRAHEQAIEYGHSFLREIAFLSVHGFLHLQGYDHMKEEDEKVMFGLQEDILNEFGITREN